MARSFEDKINKLYSEIKKLELTKDEINEINTKGFFYSIGRINKLQISAALTKIALDHNIKIREIIDLLA